MIQMTTYTNASEAELKVTRRELINKRVQVSLIGLNPATGLYAFDTEEPETEMKATGYVRTTNETVYVAVEGVTTEDVQQTGYEAWHYLYNQGFGPFPRANGYVDVESRPGLRYHKFIV